jgi:MtN3 and saliva related transmembrane protein
VSPALLQGIGYAAASCTTLSFVPQVLRVWRTRSAADISAAMYGLFLCGLALWTVYGALLSAWPIMIANTITMGLAGSVLWMKFTFGKGRHSAR